MIESGNLQLADLEADEIEVIDQICERFEQSWMEGSPQSFETLVNGRPARLRHCLIIELIKLELDYRIRNGEQPDHSEYLERFPSDREAIAVAFKESQSAFPDRPPIPDSQTRLNELSAQPLNLLADYEVLELKARGGLGEVYLAIDNKLGRKVAIKVSRNPNPDSLERMRLQREAEITSRLKHPGIVPVHIANLNSRSQSCYVMQFVEGATFRDAVGEFHQHFDDATASRFQNWDFRRLLQNMIAVCKTTAYAHEEGVIHRDIKPANIMIGKFGETVLLDWGLAKVVTDRESAEPAASESNSDHESWRTHGDQTAATVPGQPIGTPEYASPEQASGRVDDHDHRSDVFSLGATMYYLLTGQSPLVYEDSNHLQLEAAIKSIKPARAIDAAVPVDLSAICEKAMAFDPDQRYQTAVEMSDELERFLADEPVNARAPSVPVKLRRWATKNPLWVSGIATGTIVAVGALLVGNWMLGQMNIDLRNSNESLVLANKQLVDARRKTTNVLRTVTDNAMKEFLGREQVLHDKDHNLLAEILKDYESFAESLTDETQSVEIKMEAYFRIGQIQELLGNTSDANDSMLRAIELFESHPDVRTDQARYTAAIAFSKQGEFLSNLGEKDRGIQLLRKSVDMLQQLQHEAPESKERQYNLAQSRLALGVAYLATRRYQQCEKQNLLAIDALETLIEKDPENTEYLKILASFSTNLGQSYSFTGRTESAAESYKTALDRYQSLDELGFTQVVTRLNAAKTKLAYASMLKKLKQTEQAEELLHIVVDECSQLTAQFPRIPLHFVALARAHRHLADINLFRQNYDQSLIHSRAGLEAVQTAIEFEPDLERYVFTMLMSRMSLALVLRLKGEFAESQLEYEQCLRTGKELLDRFGEIKHRQALGRAHYAFAQLSLKMDERKQAITQLEQAIRVFESGTDSEQEIPIIKGLLRVSNRDLAQQLMKEGRNSDTLPYWDRVIELTPGDSIYYQTVRAVCTADVDPELALQRVDDILKTGSEEPVQIYNLSSASARAARFAQQDERLRERALDQAFDLLTKSRELGFFNDERISQLKSNNSFTWIKDDPRFDNFLAELESRD